MQNNVDDWSEHFLIAKQAMKKADESLALGKKIDGKKQLQAQQVNEMIAERRT